MRDYSYNKKLLKIYKNEFINIHLLAFQGISKTDIGAVSWLWNDPKLTDEQALTIDKIESYCIIGTLRNSRHQSLGALLPSWTPVESGIFRKDRLEKFYYYKKGNRETRELKHTTIIIFVDGVRCEDDFTNRVRNVINQIVKD